MILHSIKEGYRRVASALRHTGSFLGDKLRSLLGGATDDGAFDKAEELFYEADFGVALAGELSEKLRAARRDHPAADIEELLAILRQQLIAELSRYDSSLQWPESGPLVISIVGVNGNGKTTSCAKIANWLHSQGKKVLLCGADTYRAAAVEQIERWARQCHIDLVKGATGSDAAAVAFDGASAALARHSDALIIDTAGRLHTKTALMQELEKMRRSLKKVIPAAPHETLLVVDANLGQNGLDQAHTFNKFTPLSGLILTKLDGRAKGGIVFQIQRQLGIPVKFIGVGEGIDDLQPFDPQSFCQALL